MTDQSIDRYMLDVLRPINLEESYQGKKNVLLLQGKFWFSVYDTFHCLWLEKFGIKWKLSESGRGGGMRGHDFTFLTYSWNTQRSLWLLVLGSKVHFEMQSYDLHCGIWMTDQSDGASCNFCEMYLERSLLLLTIKGARCILKCLVVPIFSLHFHLLFLFLFPSVRPKDDGIHQRVPLHTACGATQGANRILRCGDGTNPDAWTVSASHLPQPLDIRPTLLRHSLPAVGATAGPVTSLSICTDTASLLGWQFLTTLRPHFVEFLFV